MIDKVEKGLGLCCASDDTKYCWQCPYNSETHCIECLTQDTLDILIKLQKENEALKAELAAAQQAINAAKAKLRAAGLLP